MIKNKKPISPSDLLAMSEQDIPIRAVAAYDAIFAAMIEQADIELILVGDSLGMVFQGHTTTIPVTVDHIIYHTQAVIRGAPNTHIIADMPFLTHQIGPKQALENAKRLIQEGGAHSIKLEGGQACTTTVKKIIESGIPVMGHIGLMPQQIRLLGQFQKQGKTHEEQEEILKDANALANAGVYALVLEMIPPSLAKEITKRVSIPTIGIGAGPYCNGQILVSYDILGLTPKRSFVTRYASWFEQGVEAFQNYAKDVRNKKIPMN